MRISEIMKRDVRTITPERLLLDAAELMRIRGIRHLIVMEGGSVAGVISNRDLAAISRRELEQVRVRDVMATRVVVTDPNATVAQAANRMRGAGVGCLPVVHDGKLVGIITIRDLLEELGRRGHASRATVRDGRRGKPVHV